MAVALDRGVLVEEDPLTTTRPAAICIDAAGFRQQPDPNRLSGGQMVDVD